VLPVAILTDIAAHTGSSPVERCTCTSTEPLAADLVAELVRTDTPRLMADRHKLMADTHSDRGTHKDTHRHRGTTMGLASTGPTPILSLATHEPRQILATKQHS